MSELSPEQQLGQEILELNQVIELERRDNLELSLKRYQATQETRLPRTRKRQLLNYYAEQIIEYGGKVPEAPPSKLSVKLERFNYHLKRLKGRYARYGLSSLGVLILTLGCIKLGVIINSSESHGNKETAARVSNTLWYAEQAYKKRHGEFTTDIDKLKTVSGTAAAKILDDFDGLGASHEGTIVIIIDTDGKGFTARVTDDSEGQPGELKSNEHPGIDWREGDRLAGGCTSEGVVKCVNGKWDPREGLL